MNKVMILNFHDNTNRRNYNCETNSKSSFFYFETVHLKVPKHFTYYLEYYYM